MLLPDMPITHSSALHTNATPASSNLRSHNFGAWFHVIGDAHNLQQFTPFEGHDQVYIGKLVVECTFPKMYYLMSQYFLVLQVQFQAFS